MNITKEQADKVIAALEIAKATLIEYGDWWPVGEPIAIVDCAEALTIMRGLAEDAEPPPGWKLVPIEPTDAMWDAGYDLDYCSAPGKVWADMMAVIPSPQAAQTALKSESSAQAAQAPARLPSEGKPIEALAPTEAALREVVRLSEDAGLYDDFQTEAQERPAYPEGDVVGLCVCGSWSGGRCLRCEWRAGSKP